MIKYTLKIPAKLKKAFADPKGAIRKTLMAGVYDAARKAQGEIKRNIVPGWGAGIQVRNPYFQGTLNRSIATKFEAKRAVVGTNLPYAAIQEYGGDITPRSAKALFIPLSRLGRKVGPVKGGTPLLKYGTDFMFAQKVTIKPKAYFERGVENAMPAIQAILKSAGWQIGTDAGFK